MVVTAACTVYLKTGAATLLYKDAPLPAESDLRDGEAARLVAGGFVEAVEDAEPEVPSAPHGNASTEAWAAYAVSLGVEVPDGATRDDIKALIAAL